MFGSQVFTLFTKKDLYLFYEEAVDFQVKYGESELHYC